MFDHVHENRRIMVTGQTGFKGAWLLEFGAEVSGYSMDAPTQSSNF